MENISGSGMIDSIQVRALVGLFKDSHRVDGMSCWKMNLADKHPHSGKVLPPHFLVGMVLGRSRAAPGFQTWFLTLWTFFTFFSQSPVSLQPVSYWGESSVCHLVFSFTVWNFLSCPRDLWSFAFSRLKPEMVHVSYPEPFIQCSGLVKQPALRRVLSVLKVFHLKMKEAAVLLGIFSAADRFVSFQTLSN